MWQIFLFWAVAALLCAAAAGLLLTAARRGERRLSEDADPALDAHRRQLAELDDLAARGLIGEDELAGARAEAGRRLLAAADAGTEPLRAGGRRAVLAAAGLTAVLAGGVYGLTGAPGKADQPFARRVAEWRAGDPSKLDPQRMAAVLTVVAAERPRDPEPLRNLALARALMGDPLGAAQALRQAVALAPRDATLWAALGEAFVAAGDGQVSDDARRAFGEALRLDPKAQSPRYYLGRARIGDGATAQGLSIWRELLAELPPEDGRRQGLSMEIAAVERTGRLPETTPQPAPQPAEGEDMTAAIEGMVAQLAARLEANPDDPAGWVRLVRAYSVLGETARRDAALSIARRRFKDNPDIQAALTTAAETRP